MRPWVVPAIIGFLALAGVLLIWSPWDGSGAESRGDVTPSPSVSTSPSSSPTTKTTPASTPPTNPSPSPSSSTSTGSVSVGRVVLSVGQACEFVDVGLRETTVDGTPVSCQRQANGTYAWVAP